jgi:GNAT superfamily N-acetyltransferase
VSGAVGEPGSVGRAAGPSDVAAVTRCLVSAFFEDPLWGRWTFPDPAARPEGLYELMGAWTSAAVPHGWVRMTDGAEAAAVWLPPGVPEMTDAEEERFETRMAELMGSRAGELQGVFEAFAENHPDEPSYYLSLWGTHRDHAGRGLGSALIRDDLARVDAQGAVAYLESTNPVNLPRYEALGFVRTGTFGPPGGPVITTMRREPR